MKINGVKHYLWRAVDHEGEVLESFVTRRRDKKAALRFLRKSLRRHGATETIVTDRLASYGAALKQLGSIHNHFNQEHTLTSRTIFKECRTATLIAWRQLYAG